MLRQEQTNTFQDGIISDTHPLSTTNTVMTDALNATIVTYNGNEMILLNDMGNAKLFEDDKQTKPVKLTGGFKPIGVKEHGGILYIASINEQGKFELGSFPGPDFSEDGDYKTYALNAKSINASNLILDDYYDKVFPNLLDSDIGNIIKKSNLYKNIPLIDKDENYCILKVGLEYFIRILHNDKISTPTQKNWYKVKFINLNNNKDITAHVKQATLITTPNDISGQYHYFPNIANTKLGVVFEFEDIDIFKLGLTYQLINDEEDTTIENKDILIDYDTKNPVLDIEYNGGRYPQLTNDFEVIFQTLEYKTTSEVKVTHFYIEWELTSKIERDFTDEEKNEGLSGSFYGELSQNLYNDLNKTDKTDINNKNIYKLTYEEKTGGLKFPNGDKNLCIIKLPKEDNKYILKYTIYPIWEDFSIFNCFINKTLNIHDDYKKTHFKYKIEETIDLELSPSLWGSKAKYIPADLEDRYLSKDHYVSQSDENNIVKLGVTGWTYDFLEKANNIKNVWGGIEEELFNFEKVEYCINQSLQLVEYNLENRYNSLRNKHIKGTHIKKSHNKLLNLPYFNIKVGTLSGGCQLPENSLMYVPYISSGNPTIVHIDKLAIGDPFIFPLYKGYTVKLGDQTLIKLNIKYPYGSSLNSWGLNPIVPGNIYNINNQSSYLLTYDCPEFNYTNTSDPGDSNSRWYMPLTDVKQIDEEITVTEDCLDLSVETCVVGKSFIRRDGSVPTGYIDYNKPPHMLNVFVIANHKINTPRENSSDSCEVGRINGAGLEYCSGLSGWAGFGDFDPMISYLQSSSLFSDWDSDRAYNHGQFNSWIYSIDCSPNSAANQRYERLHLQLPNDLELKYIPYFIRSRIKDTETQYVDNFDNVVYNNPTSKVYYPINNFTDIGSNNSWFNKQNKQALDWGNTVGILSPCVINLNNQPYNYVTIDKDNEFTYTFENITSKYVNIRFYLQKHYYPANLKISSTNLKIEKIYYQGKTSDITEHTNVSEINNDWFNKPYVYKLVLIVGKVLNTKLSITFKLDSKHESCFTIRNLVAYEQFDTNPYKTYAISTYSGSKILYDNKVENLKVRENSDTCCYLPEANYFIDLNIPTFTVNLEGYAEINKESIKIIQ